MSKSVQKQAKADAAEYAAAYMSYGEGAGTRRKLIEGAVDYKIAVVPGYMEAFESAHAKQDMAKHAERARKAGRRNQINDVAKRNTKAVVSGDLKNADLGVIALIVGGAIAHKTGYDKKAIKFIKGEFAAAKAQYKKVYARHKKDNDAKVHNITDAK